MSGFKNKIRAMFDIIPVASSESLDLKNPVVNPENQEIPPTVESLPQKTSSNNENGLNDLLSQILKDGEITPKEEIETLMSDVQDPVVELTRAGVVVGRTGKWLSDLRTKEGIHEVELLRHHNEKKADLYEEVLNKIREPISSRIVSSLQSSYTPPVVTLASSTVKKSAQTEVLPRFEKPSLNSGVSDSVGEKKYRGIIAEEVVAFYQNQPSSKPEIKPQIRKHINFIDPPKKRRTGWWLSLVILTGIFAYGLVVKNEIVSSGNMAFNNLQKAEENLKDFDFSGAAQNFALSYQDFSKTSQTMNFMGAGLAGIFSDLPGFNTLTAGSAGKIKSAKDLTEAGRLIAKSGQAMSEAMAALSKTGAILDPTSANKIKPLKIIGGLKDALLASNNNFQKAKALISGVDESIVPADKKVSFNDFKDKLPLLEEYLGNAIEYTEFLESIVGIDESKKYLLLFNNNSELRPTGGFPGTYGVVSFSNGGLSDFFVDDVYNLDGQLKQNIIPPKQLQHITPNWGMRDSAWFIDFPASAKKTMSFFTREAGYKVNGVIALNPDIVSGILTVLGPIQMPEYGMTLTADNFLESIQEEVEYGENRVQPKKVVVDFAPKFLEKLYSADSEKWMKVFNVLMTGLNEKDIIFYFEDSNAERFTVKEGFGGEVKRTGGDYLNINFSNIKGSKTDVVTDSSVSIDTRFENGRAIHKIILVRNHKGGDHEHGFYNRQNPAYVRVLIPENAELLNISGNDIPNFRPIVNYYLQGDFEKDRDLANFESSFYADIFPGIDKFEESGKKGIGFWMITDPKTTKKIEFEYSVPFDGNDYSFYFQKQPGLDWNNFVFKLQGEKISEIIPAMNKIGDSYLFDEELRKDFELRLKLK